MENAESGNPEEFCPPERKTDGQSFLREGP